MKNGKKKISKKIVDESAPSAINVSLALDVPTAFAAAEQVLKTAGGMELKSYYSAEDVAGLNYSQELGNPGEFPFTRGIVSEKNIAKPWIMQKPACFGTGLEGNEILRSLLKEGESRLFCYFDLATLSGYDSDHPRHFGEIGKSGVAVSSLRDMEDLFQGIPLGLVSPFFAASSSGIVLYCMYVAAAEKQGLAMKDIRGSMQNDILKDLMLQEMCIFPLEASMRLLGDLLKFSGSRTPNFMPVSIDSTPFRSAGATAVQEIAFALASAFYYANEAVRLEYDLEEFAERMTFTFSAGTDLFEEAAKFRAARKIWARWMRDKFKLRNPKSWECHIYAKSVANPNGKQKPDVGIGRSAMQILAAALGGAESIGVFGFDENGNSGGSVYPHLSGQLQKMIAGESLSVKVIDPLGGSYFVEALTSRFIEEVEQYFGRIEEIGGVLQGIQSGYFQREIAAVAIAQKVSGMTRKPAQEAPLAAEMIPGTLPQPQGSKVDSVWEKEQLERLKVLKKSRSKTALASALKELRKTANGKNSLVPKIMDCVREYATIGEILSVLKEAFGEYKPPSVF